MTFYQEAVLNRCKYICLVLLGFIHTTRDEMENGDFTAQFGFVFEQNSGREIT